MISEDNARESMNKMYRWTRYVYDLTRKYFLLGRDELIEKLNAKPEEHVIEIGCGTARNLIKLAEKYPQSHFYGLDASDEMLKTANQNLQRKNLQNTVKLQQGFAQSFDPVQLFNLKNSPDKIIFSYALSIIPPWRESLDHALSLLPSSGEIHSIDFGGQERLPLFFRKFLFWWLAKFHVYYKPEIPKYLKELQSQGKGQLELRRLYKGYAYYAVFRKA